MEFKFKNIFIYFTAASLFVFSGCAEDDDDTAEESQDQHVCEHFINGPDADVNAAASIDDAVAQAAADPETVIMHVLHTRYDVTLPETTPGSYTGFVVYDPIAEDGDYVIYMDANIAITVYDHTNADSIIEAEDVHDHSDDCAPVAYKGIFEFLAGHRYVIKLGPTDSYPTVSMIIPPLSEESDHDH